MRWWIPEEHLDCFWNGRRGGTFPATKLPCADGDWECLFGGWEGFRIIPPYIFKFILVNCLKNSACTCRVKYRIAVVMHNLARLVFLWMGWMVGVSPLLDSNAWSMERKVEPAITIKTPGKTIRLKRAELLGRSSVVQLVVEKDPAYDGRKMTYQAVPLYSLLDSTFEGPAKRPGAILQYRCLDGFSAAISVERLLNSSPDKSIAYLAIEPEKKWPVLRSKAGGQTAGPFYVIWANPEASQINREEWPFQVVEFEVKKSLQESYPNIFPDAGLAQDSPVRKGLKVFTQVCFNCHTMNHQGESHVGPDLNLPMNPTEYFKEGILKTFVRNPKSVREWPSAAMPPFPMDVVSDSEMDNLVQYFKYMSTRKVSDESKGFR